MKIYFKKQKLRELYAGQRADSYDIVNTHKVEKAFALTLFTSGFRSFLINQTG